MNIDLRLSFSVKNVCTRMQFLFKTVFQFTGRIKTSPRRLLRPHPAKNHLYRVYQINGQLSPRTRRRARLPHGPTTRLRRFRPLQLCPHRQTHRRLSADLCLLQVPHVRPFPPPQPVRQLEECPPRRMRSPRLIFRQLSRRRPGGGLDPRPRLFGRKIRRILRTGRNLWGGERPRRHRGGRRLPAHGGFVLRFLQTVGQPRAHLVGGQRDPRRV